MANNIRDFVDERENEQLREVPAQRLIEKLSLLKNRKESSRKRWFWELLQNASDYNPSVAVRLTVTNQYVVFEHDGVPFTVSDVLNMISPNSNKRDDTLHSDNIGKFGTGLVSTHILSSVMTIEGICCAQDAYYRFMVALDRSSFLDKKKLIDAITQAKNDFKESLVPAALENGYQTRISYRIGTALPSLPIISADEVDLNYLYDVLPYTLCFMPKVREVTICDERNKSSIFHITRQQGTLEDITFCVTHDGESKTLSFAYFEQNGVSSVFQYEDGMILPFSDGMSRIFCGLPLIGTEGIGLPFILNSFKFEPTTEREGIELEPGSNDENRRLMSESISLYKRILDRVQRDCMQGAFNLTNLRRKYNGTQASNTQFYNMFVPKYKTEILAHAIVKTEEGDFIPFSQVQLPFYESKADTSLFSHAEFISSASLPCSCDYEKWFEATDFQLFPDQKYTYESLIKIVENTGSLYSFGKDVDEVSRWLQRSLQFIKERNRYVFSSHSILPNQLGKLCKCNTLMADNGLPKDLKIVFNELFAIKQQKIEDSLLDDRFNNLDVLNQECRVENLCRRIDIELADQYGKNQGDSSKLNGPLNKLYAWVSHSNIGKEDLSSWLLWYYPKRATLIVDQLNETQREQALVIAQSGKMEALAQLATSGLTDKEISMLTANISRLPELLAYLNDKVDDRTHANSERGDHGEQIVFEDLIKKYPRQQGFKVVWSSKEGEPCYDFKVEKGDVVVCYCDAKTTSRGIANADSIPFFMRKSQWQFLQSLDPEVPYYIARVFMGDGGKIKYIRVTAKKE